MGNQRFHTDPTGNGGREKELPRLQAALQQRSQGQVKVFKDDNYVAKHMRHVGGQQRDVSRKIHRYVYRGTLARADGKIRREWQKLPSSSHFPDPHNTMHRTTFGIGTSVRFKLGQRP